jgi:HSP20 family molecular chaperone IbpA
MNDRQDLQTTEQRNGNALRRQPGSEREQQERAMAPRVDVIEDESGITLWADLPGVSRDQLELKVEGETLVIDAPVTPALPERLQPLYAEVRVPRYRRVFTLSRELDSARVDASLKDGVLTLRIPKHEHAQPRRIQVQVS